MKITGYYMDCMVILPDKQVKDVVCLDCATKVEAMAKIKAAEGFEGAKLAFFERQKIALETSNLDDAIGDIVRQNCPVGIYL